MAIAIDSHNDSDTTFEEILTAAVHDDFGKLCAVEDDFADALYDFEKQLGIAKDALPKQIYDLHQENLKKLRKAKNECMSKVDTLIKSVAKKGEQAFEGNDSDYDQEEFSQEEFISNVIASMQNDIPGLQKAIADHVGHLDSFNTFVKSLCKSYSMRLASELKTIAEKDLSEAEVAEMIKELNALSGAREIGIDKFVSLFSQQSKAQNPLSKAETKNDLPPPSAFEPRSDCKARKDNESVSGVQVVVFSEEAQRVTSLNLRARAQAAISEIQKHEKVWGRSWPN